MPIVSYLVKVHSLWALSLFCGSTFLPLADQRNAGGKEPGEASLLASLNVDTEYWGREAVSVTRT